MGPPPTVFPPLLVFDTSHDSILPLDKKCNPAKFMRTYFASPDEKGKRGLWQRFPVDFPLFRFFLPVQAESNGALQVFHIFIIPAHGLSGGVGQFRDSAAVHRLQLDNDIQRFLAGIVGAERTDAEGHLCPVLKVVIQRLGPVKIQAVAEQQQLGLGSAPYFL